VPLPRAARGGPVFGLHIPARGSIVRPIHGNPLLKIGPTRADSSETGVLVDSGHSTVPFGVRTCLSLAACILLTAGVVRASSSLELIVHPALAIQALPVATARSLFTLRLRRWPDGTSVKVFVLPDDEPIHRAFSKQVLNVLPHQLRRAWDRQVFTGTGQAPVQVQSEQQMLERVASTPGAVGYVSGATAADGRVRKLELE
jgi:hypothetical protein